jgi:uncharacterized protein YjbI with pentapeptide repeats
METKMVGGKIAKARKKINLSQAQLAEQLFISPQAVGKWERGESIPDIITVNRLANILGVDLNYFSENSQFVDDETVSEVNDNRVNTEQILQKAYNSLSQERHLLTNFSGSNLPGTDFSGITAHRRKFSGSSLRGSNFSGADLTGSSFISSDMGEANFDETNLTDCTLSATTLTDAIFNGTILVRTAFKSSDLTQAKFSNTKLVDVKLATTDLRKTIFENCSFTGVDFKSSDMSRLCLERQSFIDVKFDNAALKEASFKDATLKNVSFRPTFALTNKYYKTLTTIFFEGAMMDKLTYAALKGIGVDLSKVTVI